MRIERYELVHEAIEVAGRCLGIGCIVKDFDLGRGRSIDLRGEYTYRKGWRAALAQDFGGDPLDELVKIGEELQAAQRRAFYSATADLRPPYCGRDGTVYVVGHERGAYVVNDLTDALRGFENWAMRLLRDAAYYAISGD